MTSLASLFKMVLCREFGENAASHAAQPGAAVKLFAVHNGHAVQVGSAAVGKAGATSKTGAVKSVYNHY